MTHAIRNVKKYWCGKDANKFLGDTTSWKLTDCITCLVSGWVHWDFDKYFMSIPTFKEWYNARNNQK